LIEKPAKTLFDDELAVHRYNFSFAQVDLRAIDKDMEALEDEPSEVPSPASPAWQIKNRIEDKKKSTNGFQATSSRYQ